MATPVPQIIEDVEEFTTDDAYFYGLMLGDGHISVRKNCESAECGLSYNPNSDMKHVEFVRQYLAERGASAWIDAQRDNYAQLIWTFGATTPFSYFDLYDDGGEKRISPRLMHLPDDKAIRVIEGLIATDGCVNRGKEITFTNASGALVDGLRYQLIRLSVMSGLQSRRRSDDRVIVRSDGSETAISYDNIYHDVRIPAFEGLAEALNVPSVTKSHWLTYGGMVWSRIKSIDAADTAAEVFDLRVEFDETYTTVGALVHNGGKRKGAACVYLDTHHPDIMEFLELRDNTGEKERRAYNLNLATWVPDLFMKRVKEDGMWSVFDPSVAPGLNDLYGDDYEARYAALEADKKFSDQFPARKVYARMMRTLAETGNGWMCFRDTSNNRGNQVSPGNVIRLSNLCTEILEVVSSGTQRRIARAEFDAIPKEAFIDNAIRVLGYNPATDEFEINEGAATAVCNLGSINIAKGYIKNGKLDKAKLRKNVAIAVKYLDRVIDRNYYPIPEARSSNMRWRPVGLGLMGLADFFFQLRLPFESDEAIRLSGEIQEEIYYQALKTSNELAKKNGAHRDFALTRAASGNLQFDLAGATPMSDLARWDALRADIKEHGLRNSLLIAIAPTATISHICGVEECIEPIKSNLLKRETLSGEFIAMNRHLVEDLKTLGKWTPETISILKRDEGSVANLGLPEDMQALYKTVWEMSMKALIAHGARRGAFIDQSQSLNLFIDLNKYAEEKRIAVLSSLYMHAWEMGLKTTYYFRSRAASRIEQATNRTFPSLVSSPAPTAPEDTETCEACT